MKVRWNQNSLRLRITPTELATLQNGFSISEALWVPGGNAPTWQVILLPDDGETGLRQNDAAALVLHLAKTDLEELADSEKEGVYFACDAGAKRFVYYIEKDFPCVHPRASEVQALNQTTGAGAEETFAAPLVSQKSQ